MLMLAACGPFCGNTSTSGGAQHLVFTGPAAGTLTSAHVDCRVYSGGGHAQLSCGEHVKGTFRCDEVHTA